MRMFNAKLAQLIATLSPANIAQLNRALAQALALPVASA